MGARGRERFVTTSKFWLYKFLRAHRLLVEATADEERRKRQRLAKNLEAETKTGRRRHLDQKLKRKKAVQDRLKKLKQIKLRQQALAGGKDPSQIPEDIEEDEDKQEEEDEEQEGQEESARGNGKKTRKSSEKGGDLYDPSEAFSDEEDEQKVEEDIDNLFKMVRQGVESHS